MQLLLGFSVDCPVYQALVANVTETSQCKSIRERYNVCVCVYSYTTGVTLVCMSSACAFYCSYL